MPVSVSASVLAPLHAVSASAQRLAPRRLRDFASAASRAVTQNPLVQATAARLAHHRLLRFVALGVVGMTALLLMSLPVLLAHGPPFHCSPSTSEGAPSFGPLVPFCCAGAMDGDLRVGRNCLLASTSKKVQTTMGQDVSSCRMGRKPACCARFNYPGEIGQPKMYYCDAQYMQTPQPAGLVSKQPRPPPPPSPNT